MQQNSKVYVAGHNGMVGSAIVRKLRKEGFDNLVLRTSAELDLRNQQAVAEFFAKEKPEYVFLAAAKVGGIEANNIFRGEFLYDNLMIQANVIHQSYAHNVRKLLFLGSSCIYPKLAPQPLKEEYLLSGYLEATNEPYAIAKIAGAKLCENYRRQYGCDYITAMPTNLFGPNDNYTPGKSHVIPALLRKTIEAKNTGAEFVEIWGSGKPLREFLHVDDLADACFFLMNNYSGEIFVNVGSGKEITIEALAELICTVVGYKGALKFNASKPDGTPRKLLDVSRLESMGWHASISLTTGLQRVVEDLNATGYSAFNAR